MKTIPTFLFAFLILSCFSCNKKESGDFNISYYEPEDYEMMTQYLDIPHFPLDYSNRYPLYYRGGFRGNFNNDLATLGRILFYDKKLSADETVSCASCHKQELAFADDVDFSESVEGRKTNRNTLALGAVFSYQELYGLGNTAIPFFWDNSVYSTKEQSVQSFENENKMGMDMQKVVDAVKGLEYYQPLFKMAFGDQNIDKDRILDAISIFVNSIGSFDSKYDQALDEAGFELNSFGDNYPTENLAMLTSKENRGKTLYLDNCASCHGGDNGLPRKTRANNGLEIAYQDNGVGDFNNLVADMGKFKVPTLRNIMVTAPYMHDGRFATMDEILDHYSTGIQLHPNLDSELKSGNDPLQLNFTDQEKDDLVAFFNTFTDEEFLTAKRYSNPFK